MLPYFTQKFGNAASLHAVGDTATAALEEARARVAAFFGAKPGEIVFTGGATEASNLGIVGYALRTGARATTSSSARPSTSRSSTSPSTWSATVFA